MNVQGVISWGAQTGLVVSLLIIGILLIRRPFARMFGAGATYALWALPLIRLALPVIAIPQTWLPDRFRTQADPALPSETVGFFEGQSVETTLPSMTDPAPLAPTTVDILGQTPTNLNWTPFILGLWLGVGLAWFTFQVLRQRAFIGRMRKTSSRINAALQNEALRAAETAGLPRSPEVRVSNQNIGPLVTGVFRPLVILPSDFSKDYDEDQRHFAFVHEFAHVKRRDLWAALAALMFRAVNWFNPIVHYAAHKMRIDQEAACDAFVVARTGKSGGSTLDYAKTLLQAARTTGSKTKDGHLALSLAELEDKESSNA